MVKTIILIMFSIQILQAISTSVNVPGKSFKRYIDHLKHKHQDDHLSLVRSINHMVHSLMKMTHLNNGQGQDKNTVRPTRVNLNKKKPVFKMFRRFY